MDPRMDPRRQDFSIMGPPPSVTHSADAPPLPASSPSAAPPRRIIKKINLDFKKLKEAGLDRKLAEVLSKQNLGARAGIKHSSSSCSSSVVTPPTAAATTAATSTAAASSSLHSQQQQHQHLHQPELPPSAVKLVKISDYIEKTMPIQSPTYPTTSSSLERSMHVKAILKNRILNKGANTSSQAQQQRPMPVAKTPPTAAQGSASRSGGSSNPAAQGSAPRSAGSSNAASATGSFSIPKADMSVRPKHPPLLINLVNQLPKHRDTCLSNDKLLRSQQEQLQQKTFERYSSSQQKPPQSQTHSPQISMQESSQDPPHSSIQNPSESQPHSAPISMQESSKDPPLIPVENPPPPEVPIIPQKSPSPPPLIVLENKVLAPNEKIDLSDLRLPSNSTKGPTILRTKSKPLPQAIIKGKVIMNASKLKVSREKLAEMAQEIRNQANQVKLIAQAEAVPLAKDSGTIKTSTTIPTIVEASKLTNLKAKELPTLTPPAFVESPGPKSVKGDSHDINNDTAAASDQCEAGRKEETTESSSSVKSAEPKKLPKAVMSAETSCQDLPIRKQSNILSEPEKEHLPVANTTSTSSPEILESVVISEPQEASSPAHKVQSAVDFIAQLTAEHSLDDSSFMDLSPEEQRLNALFGGAAGCSFTGGLSPQRSEKEKEHERPVDINSSSKESPVEEELPIGKIMQMDDMNILHATLDVNSDSTNILRISPNAIKLRSSVDMSILDTPNANCSSEAVIVESKAESLDIATTSESATGELSPEPAKSIEPVAEEAVKGPVENELKPVVDPEPAKEVNPPAKRVPLRSKKAKINLVQRNKRPSIPNKPFEAKKPKQDDVDGNDEETTAAIIDHSSVEEHRLGAGVQGIEVPQDEEQGVGEDKEDEEQQEESKKGKNADVRDSKEDEERQEVRESKEVKQQEVKESKEDEQQGVSELKEDEHQEVRESKEDEHQEVIESTEAGPKEIASSPAKNTEINIKADNQNSSKSSIERDLTQLYHPPKMPKTKTSTKNSNQEEQSQPTAAAASVSLIEILSQEQPPPQGDAKLPFRKDSSPEVNQPQSTGIQNLITLLTAEKVKPQTKRKLSPTPPGAEETAKGMPRKKRVKTRPVLSKRTSEKKQEEMSLEFLHPVSANVGGGRIPTSSTSDDDGAMFLGFDNKEEKRSKTPVRSKRVRQMKINETDISDDATPDYDETEEEQQKPVDNDFLNRLKSQGYDSDSSDSHTYFGDNPGSEDTSCDKTMVSKEAACSWEDLKEKSKETIMDATIVSENQQGEVPIEPELPDSVIDEKDSTIYDKKSRKSRKQPRKPSPKKEMQTPAIEMNSEEPSTSKEALKKSKAETKLQSTAAATVENEETMKNIVSKINQKDVDDMEKCVKSVKSKGNRRSRCITPTINDTLAIKASPETATNSLNADSKRKEDESKMNDEPTEAAVAKEKRKSRSSTVIDKDKEETPIKSAKSKGKRSERHKTKADSPGPAATELAETPSEVGASEEPIEIVKTRPSRKSRSKTPKLALPPVAQAPTKSKENYTDTNTQKQLEEVKAAEEQSQNRNSGRSNRQSRSRKSTVPPVAKEDTKLEKITKNTDSQKQQEEVKAAEEPEHSLNISGLTKPKRQSRSKTPKTTDLAVAKNKSIGKSKASQPGSQEENKAVKEPNLGITCDENNPTNVGATEDDDKPLSSIKSKRKRQSQMADGMEPTASLVDSKTDSDTVVSRGKRKISVRLSSPARKDEVLPDPVPKRGRKSTSSQRNDQGEASLKGEEDESEAAAAPSTSTRKEKRAASAETEPTESSKKLKTAVKQEPQTFNQRLLLIRQREQLDTDEVLTDEGKGKGPLQCGLCLARTTEKDWLNHLGEHYGVGWLVGETPNITRGWVFQAMKKYIAESGEKLTCRLCQRQLGTHTGMGLHLEGCGNKQRVECDRCKGSYAKLSIGVHRQSCTGQPKRKEETPSVFNLRLLLIRKREQLDSEEILTEEGKSKGPLQCGLCLARTNKKLWQTHLGEHYGIGWLVGETPKNITRSWAMVMMKAYMEETKSKLVCRLCNHQLGSALGMMLHLETCGNKQRVECSICKRLYSILTLPGHIRVCSKRLQDTSVDNAEQPAEGDASETVYSNAGRAKRKSTIKAETKLKKIGEAMTTGPPGETTVKNEFDASESSDYDMANDKESSEEYDSEGVESNEDSIEAEQDASDCEKSKHSKKKIPTRRAVNFGEHAAKPLFLRDKTQATRPILKWKEFLQINYARCTLYSQHLPSYSTLSPEDANRLLPSKETTSVRYAYGTVRQDSDWIRLAPLEGLHKKGEYMCYLGGAIKELAWVPLPSKVTDQYLLCSLRPKMKSYARHAKLKHEDALLMLLKCTEGSTNESWSVQPELHYGIRVPNGPLHSFAFLPSGGYDQASNRLGLLAVGNATSEVHIYALPLHLKDEEKCGENVVIQLDAVITLSLDVDQPPEEDQCTKICWSEASGHNFLATGYASGRIACWDIGDTESINCFRRNTDQAYTFVPLNIVYIGERNIHFMELHYDINGTRWLAAGTLVRQFVVYDLINWSQPTTLNQCTWKNIYLATFTWSPVSEAIVLSSTHSNSRTIMLSPAGIEFDYRTLDTTLTACRSMHTNCQQNHMVLVTDIGDLAFLDVKDITHGVFMTKTMINYRAVSTTELRHLGDEQPNPKEVISVDEFHRDYGLQINPLVEAHPKIPRNCPYLTEKRRPSNPHSLALTRGNCVRCNTNSAAHTWVAMGAEHGLLRILNFKRNKFF